MWTPEYFAEGASFNVRYWVYSFPVKTKVSIPQNNFLAILRVIYSSYPKTYIAKLSETFPPLYSHLQKALHQDFFSDHVKSDEGIYNTHVKSLSCQAKSENCFMIQFSLDWY